jgi:hypothetical protein
MISDRMLYGASAGIACLLLLIVVSGVTACM